MNTVLSVVVLLCALFLASAHAKKNLWSDEDYKQVLKGVEDEDQLDHILGKAVHSWESSGGADWQSTAEESTYLESFSINWASSFADSNTGVDSGDLEGAVTGNLYIVQTYLSTYYNSFKHTWLSTGVITKPDGYKSSWTSRYTTFWTSTFTSKFSTSQVASEHTSAWTSCHSGVRTWESTFTQKVWDSGSQDSGEFNWDSEYETSTIDTWVSSWQSNWDSTLKRASSSVWYSASTSFNTNGEVSIDVTSFNSGD